MTKEIIKNNEAQPVETKEIQQVEHVKEPAKLNVYEKLEQNLAKYEPAFVQEFIKNIKSILPLINTDSRKEKRFLTNEEIASLLEYANFGIDINPKAGMLYYFSRGGQFGFLTPRAIIEMLGKIGITATVEVICSNDQFKVDPANLQIKHLLALPRGETIGVYAILREKGKIIAIEVMDMNELIKIQSIADKYKKSATWETFFEEMAKKTMLKRIAKRTPLLDNNNIKQALEIDNKEYSKPETTEKLNNVAVTTQPERI
jgi:recombinational DNA repair protein RecT